MVHLNPVKLCLVALSHIHILFHILVHILLPDLKVCCCLKAHVLSLYHLAYPILILILHKSLMLFHQPPSVDQLLTQHFLE